MPAPHPPPSGPVVAGRERVTSRGELLAAGLANSTITHRTGPHGPWQRLLPGVVLLRRGTPTRRERLLGAVTYAGPDSVVTGLAALEVYGLRTARLLGDRTGPAVHVLVPHGRRRRPHGFVVVERTRGLPPPRTVRGLPLAPPVRALLDACRRMDRPEDVRELVGDVLQHGGVGPDELAAALGAAVRQRTAPGGAVREEMAAGVLLAARARARLVISRAGLPEPLYDVDLVGDDGTPLAGADGWYPEWGCGYQLDPGGRPLDPAGTERTVRVRPDAAALGAILSSVPPALVLTDPGTFTEALNGLVETNRYRTDQPRLQVRPAGSQSPSSVRRRET